MIITISGRPGSGKTSVGKELAKRLDYDFLSVGDLQGEIALEKGITINELMALGKKDKSIHIEMDKKTKQIGNERDNFVMEGWIAFHFIPHSKKIFLEVDETIGAERIFKDNRKDEPQQKNIEQTKQKVQERVNNTRDSFKKYYNVDFLNISNYDFVMDTSNKKIEEVVAIIVNSIK